MLYIMLTLLFCGSALTPDLVVGGAYADIGANLRIGALVLAFVLVIFDFVRIVFFRFCVVDVKSTNFTPE